MCPDQIFVQADSLNSQAGAQAQTASECLPGEILSMATSADRRLYHAVKRCIDIAGGAALLILFLPLMLAIAALIKLETPGPILFVQQRVGSRQCYRDGNCVWEIRNFRFYKFRSMFRDTDEYLHVAYIRAFAHNRVEASSDPRAGFKLAADQRITRVGSLLRRTSLDELPQLLNVLKGDMSLVGPRPVPAYEVAEYQPQHWQRLAVLPGITGLWQINGRGRVTFEEMIRMDLEYVRNQSFGLDCKILFGTIPAVLFGRGAK